MKKKAMTLLLVTATACTITQVDSIVFIPPVIYIATFSLGTFITNVFLFLAVWLAVKGVTDRSYFGKPVHELVGMSLQLIGKILILITSATLPTLILNPITADEIIISSLFAGILSLAILFLDRFREYHLIPGKERNRILRSITLLSIAIIVITYASTTLAIETKTLHMREGYETEHKPEYALLPTSPAMGKETADKYMAGEGGEYPGLEETLWFYPENNEPCIIYYKNILVLETQPTRNCYYYTNNRAERISCPIPLKIRDIRKHQIEQGECGSIQGRGSCSGNYTVTVGETGFYVNR